MLALRGLPSGGPASEGERVSRENCESCGKPGAGINAWAVSLKCINTDLRVTIELCDRCHDAADLLWHTQFRTWKAHLLKLLQVEAGR